MNKCNTQSKNVLTIKQIVLVITQLIRPNKLILQNKFRVEQKMLYLKQQGMYQFSLNVGHVTIPLYAVLRD